MIQGGARLPDRFIATTLGDARQGIASARQRRTKHRQTLSRQACRAEQILQIRAQRFERAVPFRRARDVERDDVAGAFPDRTEMRVAHETRVAPFFDVARAAAHFHRVAGHAAGIAASAELDQRRKDAHAFRRLPIAGVGLFQQQGDLHEHRTSLLRGQHHLEQLPLHQGHIDQLAAERFAMARDVQRLGQRAAHQTRRTHAVRQPRHVDHVGHLMEAAPHFADQIRHSPFQHDLAARHRTAAELVLQTHDPIAVARAIRQCFRQQEQPKTVNTGRRLVHMREHHREIGVGVRAKPFVTVQTPRFFTVHAGFERRTRRDTRDIRTCRLFGHEHRALKQRVEIARRQHRHKSRDQFGRAEFAQRTRERIGHADGAAQAEFRLHEQEGQRVFDQRRRRFLTFASVVAHRRQPQFRVGHAFKRDVIGMLVDALQRFAAPRAMPQLRRISVGGQRPDVEFFGRSLA